MRDASNLVGEVCQERSASRAGMVGPWGKPDRNTEKAAVQKVKRKLLRSGFNVRSREKEICGYDLHATKARKELHIEVKGCASSEPYFFLTRTEKNAAEADPHWRIWIVTNVKNYSAARIRKCTNKQMLKEFELIPSQWRGSGRQ